MNGSERDCAHLELIFCSSEDDRFPATNLTRPGSGPGTQLAIWESEKFCEFPQELVFQVNRGLPTRIDQVNLLSHSFKVATRVEIFTSSAATSGIHDGKTGVRFDRLGFVCFMSSDSVQLAACELQEVQLPRPTSKITLLRLVLHSCHQTRSNLFSQVGLAAVAALGPQKDAKVMLPMISSPRKAPAEAASSLCRRVNAFYGTNSPRPAQETGIESPRARDIWIQESQEHKTPEQICTDIQIGKQLAQFAGDENFVQPWVLLEREANRLVSLLERNAVSREQTNTDGMGVDAVIKSFTKLEHHRRRQDNKLSQKMSPRSIHRPLSTDSSVTPEVQNPKAQYVHNRFLASQWMERESLVWQLTGWLQDAGICGDRKRRQACQFPVTDAEALEVLITSLDDSNVQVFIAGCAFFRALLTSLPYFQDTVASKADAAELVDCLLERLDSRAASVRNAAAFSLLKVAGSTRMRGTFVTHLLLKHVEAKNFQLSDQQLLALLKLLAAMLLSFHCCASFDIAPRRVLRFLLLSDADQHENALVREAAKQLVLALCDDVDEEYVLKNYVKKLPLEHQRRYGLPLRRNSDARLEITEERQTSTSSL